MLRECFSAWSDLCQVEAAARMYRVAGADRVTLQNGQDRSVVERQKRRQLCGAGGSSF